MRKSRGAGNFFFFFPVMMMKALRTQMEQLQLKCCEKSLDIKVEFMKIHLEKLRDEFFLSGWGWGGRVRGGASQPDHSWKTTGQQQHLSNYSELTLN